VGGGQGGGIGGFFMENRLTGGNCRAQERHWEGAQVVRKTWSAKVHFPQIRLQKGGTGGEIPLEVFIYAEGMGGREV